MTVRNRDTLEWMADDGTFSASYAKLTVTLDSPGATSTTWARTVELPEGEFRVEAAAFDAAGNSDQSRPGRRFFVENGVVVVPDVENPTVAVVSPIEQAEVPGPTVTLDGTASDDVGVASVTIAVRRLDTSEWLQTDGTWANGFALQDVTVNGVGTKNATWQWIGDLPSVPIRVKVNVTDTSGKREAAQYWRRFTVITGNVSPEPDGAITAPARNQVVTGPSVTFSGVATDDIGVVAAYISIRDRNSGQFYRGNGVFGAYANLDTVMSDPGAARTDWTWTGDLPPGDYRIEVNPVDADSNRDPSRAGIPFSVQ